MRPRIRRGRFGPLVLAIVGSIAMPASVWAHAELVESSPPGASTVSGSPSIVDASYSENLDPGGSSLLLVHASGATIARGGVPAGASGAAKKTMSIESRLTLEPGAYTVKSTTRSADDGDIERVQWTFTVEAAPATASGEPTPICTDGCNGEPSGGPMPSPSPSCGERRGLAERLGTTGHPDQLWE